MAMDRQANEDMARPNEKRCPIQALFHVYEDETFLGKRLFENDSLSIGSSRKADILLNHQSVEEIHAVVRLDGSRLILNNHYPNDGLRVNGLSVESVPLKSRDIINIGPYEIQVEIEALPPPSAVTEVVDASKASKTTKQKRKTTAKPIALPPVRKDSNPYSPSTPAESDQLDFSDISSENGIHQKEVLPSKKMIGGRHPSDGTQTEFMLSSEALQEPAKTSETAVEVPQFQFSDDEEIDEDDAEEALWVAPFSLQDKLNEPAQPARIPKNLPKHLSIIKNIASEVADVAHLGGGKSYYIPDKKGARLFARQTAQGIGQVYFTQSMCGYVKNVDQTTVDLDRYKVETYLYNRRKQIYRFTVPDDAVVVILDGDISFTVNHCAIGLLSDIKEAILPKSLTWRHWTASLGFHLFLILVAGILYCFQATAPLDNQPRFVKIDPSLLQQLEMKKVKIEKPKPKETPPPPTPEPQKLARKTGPVKKTTQPKPAPKTTAAKKTIQKVAKAARPSKHPKAGGGFGKGNTTNRNVNQAGLLSLLGNSKIAGSSDAIASVTNLDAVPSPGATQKNYSVGGIKGSLGTGKIAVTHDTIIQTRGSTQVLRSAGASGSGRVAALEKGKTGKKQVQAMVTAKMTRTVKIQGGMSREAVKRVIDQHLDEITMCYETALLSNQSISGRVVFEWKILMSGRVGEIKIVASNINSNEIHECIKASIKGWQFPIPTGSEVVVSYPFVFDLVAF
jgi:pSer/pThr/pTyr-binding forkhead associated (FHA) protein/outer membrane biosynthesis protein TonB